MSSYPKVKSSVSWPGPTPKVSDRRLQVDYGVLLETFQSPVLYTLQEIKHFFLDSCLVPAWAGGSEKTIQPSQFFALSTILKSEGIGRKEERSSMLQIGQQDRIQEEIVER